MIAFSSLLLVWLTCVALFGWVCLVFCVLCSVFCGDTWISVCDSSSRAKSIAPEPIWNWNWVSTELQIETDSDSDSDSDFDSSFSFSFNFNSDFGLSSWSCELIWATQTWGSNSSLVRFSCGLNLSACALLFPLVSSPRSYSTPLMLARPKLNWTAKLNSQLAQFSFRSTAS